MAEPLETRVRFVRAFDWRPDARPAWVSYPAGHVGRVPRACAAAALAAGAAVAERGR